MGRGGHTERGGWRRWEGDGKEDRKGNGMRDEEVDDWERGGWERMRERG